MNLNQVFLHVLHFLLQQADCPDHLTIRVHFNESLYCCCCCCCYSSPVRCMGLLSYLIHTNVCYIMFSFECLGFVGRSPMDCTIN